MTDFGGLAGLDLQGITAGVQAKISQLANQAKPGGESSPVALDRASDARAVVGADSEFSAALMDAIGQVNRLAKDSEAKASALARGEAVEPHDLLLAMGKSEVAFNLMLEVRNKLVDAWQTISRSVM